MDILLVRHGEAAASWGDDPDPGLSPLGRKQALQVRDELENYRDAELISSPLLRAQETGQPLANVLRKSLHIDERYREIPSPGDIADRKRWLRELMKQEWEEQSEVIKTWRDTAWSGLFELEKPAIIFTHFMIINAICAKLTDRPETVCCVPDNGSIMHLQMVGSSLQLVSVGRQLATTVN